MPAKAGPNPGINRRVQPSCAALVREPDAEKYRDRRAQHQDRGGQRPGRGREQRTGSRALWMMYPPPRVLTGHVVILRRCPAGYGATNQPGDGYYLALAALTCR